LYTVKDSIYYAINVNSIIQIVHMYMQYLEVNFVNSDQLRPK